METTFRIIIKGRVQGVGFRPFVFRQAKLLGIRGEVSNNEEGVIIRATGGRDALNAFYEKLTLEPPPVSRVIHHYFEEIPPEAYEDFRIIPSSRNRGLNLQLTPDFALCPECHAELLSPDNRRSGYPFISCVNCGPRWALTKTFPFEREHTSMHVFGMCPECLGEYRDPGNRRFHSQTNSCKACGIEYWLAAPDGERISTAGDAVFERMAGLLGEGCIIAVRNTSGYLLCCDARQEGVIQRLRDRKRRPSKPFAVLYPSLGMLKEDMEVGPGAVEALVSAERPIVLLPSGAYRGDACLKGIAPGLDQLGVMLPYTGILAMLAETFPYPLVATSGNIHGSPICYSPEDAREKLAGVADYFFEHTLEIIHPQDDSVIRIAREPEQSIILRRSRGMAPNFSRPVPQGAGSGLLALGADLKSSIGYLPNDFLYVSEYLGNLENLEVYQRYERTVSGFVGLFDGTPKALLTDLHPGYHSTRYGQELALQWGVPVHQVQHHKAHFAAVLGEHQLLDQDETVLGVIWDGTGYGEDGSVWGGEFFRYSGATIERAGHVDPYDWLSGDKMAREPRLSLFSLWDGPEGPLKVKFSSEEWRLYGRLKEKNALKTTSMGRLFDAVSSLLGLCDTSTFEGEAAMLLEAAATGFDHRIATCHVTLDASGNIPARTLLRSLHYAQVSGVPAAQIAGDFIFTLVNLIFGKAALESVGKIAFSGGVFQNALLVELLHRCNPGAFELYFHRELSPNDENIPFGQLMYHLNCR